MAHDPSRRSPAYPDGPAQPSAGPPPFRPRAPWFGSDLQTLRNVVSRRRIALDPYPSERVELPLGDGSGDTLMGTLQHPEAPERRPLVVLVHGLGGNEESHYMCNSAAFWLHRGHPVLRLNQRGAGPSRKLCRFEYHAGRSEDLRAALRQLDAELTGAGLLLVGYSIGGNVLLKFLAEYGGEFPLRAAASVSAPIDLAAASERMLARRNSFYQWWLLRGLKRQSLEGRQIDERERQAIVRARNLLEFDDTFVAPRNGFSGALEYYDACRALRFLPEIRVPTLVIHALDDPWIPPDAYTSFAWRDNPHLVPLLSPGGGHVGFHARDHRQPWHDRVIARFAAQFV